MNYRDHAAEAKLEIPKTPVVFTKFPNCISGPFADVVLSSDRNLSPALKEALSAFVGAEQARNQYSIRQSYTDRDDAFEAFKTKLFGAAK